MKSLLPKRPLCPYHRGKRWEEEVSPYVSEKPPNMVSFCLSLTPASSPWSLWEVTALPFPVQHCQPGMVGGRGRMCAGWVRAHLWEDRSRVDGREVRRRAVIRVVSGSQPDCLPFNCAWSHLSPTTLPPNQRTLPVWIRPVKRQWVGGLQKLAGVGLG